MRSPATSTGETHAVKCDLATEVLRSSGQLRLRVTGWSMLPTIWPGDTLMIVRAEIDAVDEGDIVLCARDRRFSVHRVEAKSAENSTILTRGDAMPQSDAPVPNRDLLGKVAFIERNGKRIEPSRTLRPSQRAVAAMVRHSDIAARVVVSLHGMRRHSEVENSQDQAVASEPRPSEPYPSEPCESEACQS